MKGKLDKAIIYTSNTGNTKRYAELLSKKYQVPCYSFADAKGKISADTKVVYMGWIMASGVKGYQKAAAKYQIEAVCGVGMGKTGTQIAEVRKASKVPDDIPVFTLQGGFDVKKLSGGYRFMMNIMVKTAGKALANKNDRTAEEDDMLDMMIHGGNRVSEDNLAAIEQWMEEN